MFVKVEEIVVIADLPNSRQDPLDSASYFLTDAVYRVPDLAISFSSKRESVNNHANANSIGRQTWLPILSNQTLIRRVYLWPTLHSFLSSGTKILQPLQVTHPTCSDRSDY